MDSNQISKFSNPLICIYTNKNKNEFAIGLKEDGTFRALTKVGDFYTSLVDAFENILIINRKNDIDWQSEELDVDPEQVLEEQEMRQPQSIDE